MKQIAMYKIFKDVVKSKEIVVLILVILLLLLLSLGSNTFLNISNFESLQATIAPNAIIATGMMILLISGVFDLSVGSVMGLSGAVVAVLLGKGLPVVPSVIASLGVGLVFGFLNGFLAALTGILYTSRLGNSAFYLGLNVELKVIISCLIGGASIAGGQGSIFGSLLGVVFMALIVSIFNILEIGTFWQNIIVGIILIFIVSLDAHLVTRRRRILGEI
jgi:ribose/xylose/arabinose/galactoside ABC-type transport system permease subunit